MSTDLDLPFTMEFLGKRLTKFTNRCSQLKYTIKKTKNLIFQCKYKQLGSKTFFFLF